MSTEKVQSVADEVARRARRQGFVLSQDVRDELTRAGMPENMWKQVIAAVKPALQHQGGRWSFPSASGTVRSLQDEIHQAVHKLVEAQKRVAAKIERRGDDRFDFVQPVQVHTDDGRTFALLSRDLSSTGIRLVGTKRLLGQKLLVTIPNPEGGPSTKFVVRVLWTCSVGDDLFENGGNFLEVPR
jgi:hypothetical protein